MLAVYGGSYYAGSPALVETAAGKGKVLHFGGTFTRENIREFLAYTGVLEPWADQVAVPADCEIAVREKDGRRYLMVLNFAWEPRTVTLKQEAVDLDDGKILQGMWCCRPLARRYISCKNFSCVLAGGVLKSNAVVGAQECPCHILFTGGVDCGNCQDYRTDCIYDIECDYDHRRADAGGKEPGAWFSVRYKH